VIIKLDKQIEAQPKKVEYCAKCVVSNQRPRITFDKNGICSACAYAWKKHHEIDWEERDGELWTLADRHRSKDGGFDVIVPGSGGKDSAFSAHILKSKYGLHPLVITWAPFIYTDIGWKNFNSFVKSGFTVLTCFQNGVLHRKLAKIAFELKGDAFEPFVYGQKAFAFHTAIQWGIPLIFYGENGEVEYGGSIKNKDKPFESIGDWDTLYYKGAGIDTLLKAGREMGTLTEEEATDGAFNLYRPPSLEKIQKLGAEMHWLSYYKKWVPQENFYYAQKYTGFAANEEGRSEGTYSKYASLDDKTDGFHYYMAFIKFGIGRCTSDAAHEIRDGHITREEGIALVRRYDGEFPKKHFKEFLEYIDITEKHFWEVVDSYRPPHLWEKVAGEWRLKHQIS